MPTGDRAPGAAAAPPGPGALTRRRRGRSRARHQFSPPPAGIPMRAVAALPPAAPVARLRRLALAVPWPIYLITAVAAALRFAQLGAVSPNSFYDAAVASMSLSWHNFLFGAFDPGALLSIDKPPLDLWLQVASVKVLGWSNLALKLPEAVAGTACVPLLYDAVRRAAGRPAGLAAAAVLAVLPESVLTARSDTMDAVMMLLVIAALWLIVVAAGTGRRRLLLLAGVALGLAFEVKLLQALLPVPAFVVLYALAAPGTVRRRAGDLALAGVLAVAVGLCWPVVVALAPGHHPWAVGSSDGSIWNAMFVFNGAGKIGGAAASTKPGGPGPLRLLVSTGWHYDLLFGCVLMAAAAIGLAGLVAARPRARLTGRSIGSAFAIALATWLVVGLIAFDTMVTVHARYLEALAPALAAATGLGTASIARLSGGAAARPPSLRIITLALLCLCLYTFGLGRPPIAWASGALIIAVIGAALVARGPGRLGALGRWLTAGLIMACALLFPVHESVVMVRTGANDSAGLATATPAQTAALARFLASRTVGRRYELAVDEPLSLAPLLIEQRRAILPLTSFGGRPLTALPVLRGAVLAGQVRYGLVGAYGCGPRTAAWAACTPAARWIRHVGRDVTRQAGLTGPYRLYQLAP